MGRPIKNGQPHEPRRNAQLLARIGGEMKEHIVSEAKRLDQSQSTVAARLLEKGRFWEAFERRIIADGKPPPMRSIPVGCKDQLRCDYHRMQTEPPSDIWICGGGMSGCPHAIYAS